MCIGKGLASGLPLAGIVARAEVMDWAPAATARRSAATPSPAPPRWSRSSWSRAAWRNAAAWATT